MTLNKVGRSKAAKARKLSQSTGYQVRLIGTTWEGYESTYSYSFPYLPTDTQVRQRAGDFQDVTDYEVTSVTRVEYSDGHRVKRDVVIAWQHPESQDKWIEANV